MAISLLVVVQARVQCRVERYGFEIRSARQSMKAGRIKMGWPFLNTNDKRYQRPAHTFSHVSIGIKCINIGQASKAGQLPKRRGCF